MSDKADYQFVDTNILVYAHDLSAGGKHEQAKKIVRALWQSGEGCLSIQVLQEFYVTITQKVALPLSGRAASEIISDLGAWRIHKPGVENVLGAITLQERYKTSFWDAMIIQSALQLGCHLLWSEDLNPGQVYKQVRVQNPFF